MYAFGESGVFNLLSAELVHHVLHQQAVGLPLSQ